MTLLIGWGVTFLATWLGAYLGYRFSIQGVRHLEVERKRATMPNYLRHLRDEFEYNRSLLDELRLKFLSGPPLRNLWAPATMVVSHLRFHAWDRMVQDGIVPLLPQQEQRAYWVIDRETRDVARIIQTSAAHWAKLLDWEAWDQQNGVAQPVQVTTVKHMAMNEAKKKITQVIDLLDKAITNLPPTVE
ncbi:MAG: hypothetical protein ACOY94_00540 [Bacillota bacterium]